MYPLTQKIISEIKRVPRTIKSNVCQQTSRYSQASMMKLMQWTGNKTRLNHWHFTTPYREEKRWKPHALASWQKFQKNYTSPWLDTWKHILIGIKTACLPLLCRYFCCKIATTEPQKHRAATTMPPGFTWKLCLNIKLKDYFCFEQRGSADFHLKSMIWWSKQILKDPHTSAHPD